MGQAVLSNHMYADSFLLRDIQNILDYFSDYEIDLPSAEEIFEKLTSRIPDPELLKLKIT
jgi:serine/threonine-protein kinase RIO1